MSHYTKAIDELQRRQVATCKLGILGGGTEVRVYKEYPGNNFVFPTKENTRPATPEEIKLHEESVREHHFLENHPHLDNR